MEQFPLNIIHSKHYEDEPAYVFNVYKDDIDSIQNQTEACSMSAMFQGSNCTNFSDMLEHLEPLLLTKRALIPRLVAMIHLILMNPATSCTPKRSFSVAQRIKT